jgi:hypothetical protein
LATWKKKDDNFVAATVARRIVRGARPDAGTSGADVRVERRKRRSGREGIACG